MLDQVLFNLRCRQNTATGYTPAKGLFGFEIHRPGEWRDPPQHPPEPAADRIRQVHANELRYRQRRYAQSDASMPITPRLGEFVMVKAHHPPGKHFAERWVGPYPVVGNAGPTAIWVEQSDAQRTKYHIDQVRPMRQLNQAQESASRQEQLESQEH